MRLTKRYSVVVLAILFLLFGYLSIGVTSEPTGRLLADFSDASAAEKWISVNDDVMGGVSEGGFRITDENTLEFSGNLSLENRGGFTSIRTQPADLNLDGYDKIALRVKGDGRTYYFNLRTSSRRAASSYRASFETRKDAWEEIRINLKDFVYTAYGRIIAGSAPLKANDIQSVGFTLTDKKAGPFRLEVDWIRAEKTAAAKQAGDEAAGKDIVDTAVAAGNFKTLVAAVKAAGLVDALKAEGPLTVFAPTDEAFARLPEGTVEELLLPENRDTLIAVLTYHVVPGKVMLGRQSRETLQGASITIGAAGPFKVNAANVIAADVMASNGVIHIIDAVLLPPVEKLTPKQAAREVIELAIRRGVPLFNAGQPSACASIYEVAVESLLKSHAEALDAEDRAVLQDALRKIRSADETPHQNAWTLRRALNAVYESLGED
ncbi:MAG: CIA30 family protein [Planctomycetota bacterium]|jgi:uncharacterized surface protein with fasciclin (FAS1) repeats